MSKRLESSAEKRHFEDYCQNHITFLGCELILIYVLQSAQCSGLKLGPSKIFQYENVFFKFSVCLHYNNQQGQL